MKMAKATEADISAAIEVAQILDAIGKRFMPMCLCNSDDDDTEWFDIDSHDDCRKVIQKLLDIERGANVFRAAFGMAVLMDSANEVVDPDSDILEMHPKYRQIGEWLAKGDVGISSKTMVAIALGAESGRFDAPYDPSDFYRCYELVKQVPAIRNSFDDIAKKVPAFAGILRDWGSLCKLFDDEKASGMCHLTYDRIKALRAEAGATA